MFWESMSGFTGRNMFNLLLLGICLFCRSYGRHFVDLTHVFDQDTPKYPLGWLGKGDDFKYYNMEVLYNDYYAGTVWISINKIEYYEHQGTHIDAPIHFGAGRQTLEAIPPERLIGPGVVIDVREKARTNADYAVTVDDIREHEAQYGRIPPLSIINMNSGWSHKYPNAELVFGSSTLNDTSSFHFPGWSIDACKMLLEERQVSVLGVDTPSSDPANKIGYPCHVYLQNNEVPLLEYVANLDNIPPRNTTIVLGAPKFRKGTGGPTRIFAIIEEDNRTKSVGSVFVSSFAIYVTFALFPFL